MENTTGKEGIGSNLLTVSLQIPHVEGYGDNASLTLVPSSETIRVVDWRTQSDLSEIAKEFPNHSVDMRDRVVINADNSDPVIQTEEALTGCTSNEFDPSYEVSEKISIGDGTTAYMTSYPGLRNALKTGTRKQIYKMSPTSLFQRHVIGTIQSGDLTGQTVFTDYRFIEYNGKILVDGLMVHGSDDKMKLFLEKLAKTKAPEAKYPLPTFDKKTGRTLL